MSTTNFSAGWYGGPDGEFRWWDGDVWVEAAVPSDAPSRPTPPQPEEGNSRPAITIVRADQRMAGYDLIPGTRVTFIGLPVPGGPSGPPPSPDEPPAEPDTSGDAVAAETDTRVSLGLRQAERYRLAGLGAMALGAVVAAGGSFLGVGVAAVGGAAAGLAGVLFGRGAARSGAGQ